MLYRQFSHCPVEFILIIWLILVSPAVSLGLASHCLYMYIYPPCVILH